LARIVWQAKCFVYGGVQFRIVSRNFEGVVILVSLDEFEPAINTRIGKQFYFSEFIGSKKIRFLIKNTIILGDVNEYLESLAAMNVS
jgi:hypothetical protein